MVDKLSGGEINSGPFNAVNSLIERMNVQGLGDLTQGPAVADSTAIDVAGLVVDFNELLASLRTAGVIAV